MMADTLPATVSAARQAGTKFYFTNKPCKRGHLSPRYTKTKICCECCAEANRAWPKLNVEQNRAKANRYRLRNTTAIKTRQRRWYVENRKLLLQKYRETYAADPARKKELSVRYLRANPEKARQLRQRRRARLKGSGEHHTVEELAHLRLKHGNRCAYCKAAATPDEPLTIDHIEPLARGGSNKISNIQFLCRSCNCAKGAADPLIFARSRGMLL